VVQAHIIFSGRVQGVGFRFTVQRYALELKLTGWVKNLPDGTVETLVEGAEEQVERLCSHLEEFFKGYIQDKRIDLFPSQGSFHTFEIAY